MTNSVESPERLNESAVPLKGEKRNRSQWAVIVIVFILAGIFLQGLFHHANKTTSSTPKVEEPYVTANPMTNEQNKQPAVNDTLEKQHEMQEKLMEAKAHDFMERLQASQNMGSDDVSGGMPSTPAPMTEDHNATATLLTDAETNPNAAFLSRAAFAKTQREYATSLAPLSSVIGQGKFIFGTLAVAIHSDLPGQIEAVVNQDIYGEQGKKILIPRGSHLIGEYRSGLANNQSRLFTVWTRIKEPNGIDIRLGSEGTDSLGRAGLMGQTDTHFFDRFGSAILISMMSAGASTIGVSSSDPANSLSSYRQSISQALSEQAKNTLDQNTPIPPTVHVPQGQRIVVFVNCDLDFSRVYR